MSSGEKPQAAYDDAEQMQRCVVLHRTEQCVCACLCVFVRGFPCLCDTLCSCSSSFGAVAAAVMKMQAECVELWLFMVHDGAYACR